MLVRSSVANLKFGLALRSPDATRSLTKLCTLPSANTWTLIPLANLPIWSGGNFNTATGVSGYSIDINLAAGASYLSPANDTWQNGNFIGAVGQDNFAAQAVNSTFDIAFVQHEPGASCTTLIDCPFPQNLEECERYYQKTYQFGDKPGTANANGAAMIGPITTPNWGAVWAPISFKRTMAKIPTMTAYSPNTGAINTIRDVGNNADRAVAGVQNLGDSGFAGFGITGQATTGNPYYQFHWVADTGM